MIYLDFDGKPTPGDDLVWLAIAPCGCATGAVVVSVNGVPYATTEEQARYELWGSKREAKADKRPYELALHNTLRERMPIPCPHKAGDPR